MQRTPEPELMLRADQAEAYARADFAEPHGKFITLFREHFPAWPGDGHVLDLGCGPGDIARRFALAYPACRVDGIDGSSAMIEAGRDEIENDMALNGRVKLLQIHLPNQIPPRAAYDAIISNSLLHHLHDPFVLWNAVNQHAKSGAPVFIVDLRRPDSRAEAERLTSRYAGKEPDVLRHDFFHSLLASFTVEEVKEQLATAKLERLSVSSISDRHLMVHGHY